MLITTYTKVDYQLSNEMQVQSLLCNQTSKLLCVKHSSELPAAEILSHLITFRMVPFSFLLCSNRIVVQMRQKLGPFYVSNLLKVVVVTAFSTVASP
jgi:hypothetical protein